ncbi:MAG: hypothetical protein ACRCTQ_01250 [Brevinemataceae bacterium]
MRKVYIAILMIMTSIYYTQENQTTLELIQQRSGNKSSNIQRTSSISEDKMFKQLEFGLTGMDMNLVFPAFDVTLAFPFFKKGVNALLFKNSLFTYMNGNYKFAPTFALFGVLWELQYRVTTKKGFVFAMETGLGVVGEFATAPVFSVEKGFHSDPGTAYGMFSAALRFGHDFYAKYKQPIVFDFMIGYRMLFPYNLFISNNIVFGFGLSYMFDLK